MPLGAPTGTPISWSINPANVSSSFSPPIPRKPRQGHTRLIEAYLKFSDGSNMKVVDESMKPPTGTGAQFGPFTSPAGKVVNQVNFKIGANKDPGGTGFSYRISVQACN